MPVYKPQQSGQNLQAKGIPGAHPKPLLPPPVYKPQQSGQNLQAKGIPGAHPKPLLPPPVYKPQQSGQNLQAKGSPGARAKPLLPPPVYKPQQPGQNLQAKGTLGTHAKALLPPPVYKPQQPGQNLQPKGSQRANGKPPLRPPVSNPFQSSAAGQRGGVSKSVATFTLKPGPLLQPKTMGVQPSLANRSGNITAPVARTIRANSGACPVFPAGVGLPLRSGTIQTMEGKLRRSSRAAPQGNPEVEVNLLKQGWSGFRKAGEQTPAGKKEQAKRKRKKPGKEEKEKEVHACAAKVTMEDGTEYQGAFDPDGMHAEMDALQNASDDGADFENIKSIHIDKEPCPRCAFVLRKLGLSDKVTYDKSGQKDYPTWRMPSFVTLEHLGIAHLSLSTQEEAKRVFCTIKWWR